MVERAARSNIPIWRNRTHGLDDYVNPLADVPVAGATRFLNEALVNRSYTYTSDITYDD